VRGQILRQKRMECAHKALVGEIYSRDDLKLLISSIWATVLPFDPGRQSKYMRKVRRPDKSMIDCVVQGGHSAKGTQDDMIVASTLHPAHLRQLLNRHWLSYRWTNNYQSRAVMKQSDKMFQIWKCCTFRLKVNERGQGEDVGRTSSSQVSNVSIKLQHAWLCEASE
jgi:hypothetical protein